MKRVKKGMGILFLIGLLYVGFIFGLIIHGRNMQPTESAKAMFILGAQVKGSNPAYPSQALKERLNTAIVYLKQNKQTQVVVCGGQGSDESQTEASVMASYLKNHGIAANRIIEEGRSTRTKQNLENGKKLLNTTSNVIVTSDFHAYRGKLLAERLGFKNVSVLPAKTPSGSKIRSYLREIIALSYAIVFDW